MCFVKQETKDRQNNLVKQQEEDAAEATRIAQKRIRERKVKDIQRRQEELGGIRTASRGGKSLKVESKFKIVKKKVKFPEVDPNDGRTSGSEDTTTGGQI